MPGQLKMGALLGYKEFYPDVHHIPIKDYVDELGRDLLVNTSSYFLSHFRINAVPDNATLLRHFFTFKELKWYDVPEYQDVEARYNHILLNSRGQSLTLVTVEPFLRLFNWLQENPERGAGVSHAGPANMLSYFKLILVFNKELVRDYQKSRQITDQYVDELRYHRQLLAISFPQNDFLNVDYLQILVAQFYKLIELLDFMAADDEFKGLFTSFLSAFNCRDKEHYVSRIYRLIVPALKPESPRWLRINVPEGDDFEDDCCFLEKVSLSAKDEVGEQDDYLAVRNRPIFEIEKGNYQVLYDSFLIKKIYNGLIFTLSGLSRRKGVFKGDFLGRVRKRFSESTLLYRVMANIYGGQNLTMISGDDFQKTEILSEPDYYLRQQDNVLLFESKDFYIKGSVKLSYDFRFIEPEFKRDRLDKAVRQLAGNVERTLLKQMILDTDYNADIVRIFPIILVHDALYSCPGLNYWINQWFLKELDNLKKKKELAKVNWDHVLPLTILEIDTLILYEPQIRDNRMPLIPLLEEYHKQVDLNKNRFPSRTAKKDHAQSSALPFAEFITRWRYDAKIELDINRLADMIDRYDQKLNIPK